MISKVDILNRALHATVNSLLQYIEVATPYVPPGFDEKMAAILRMRDAEVHLSHDISETISALDGVPAVGVFPYWNVDLNYLDVRHLARMAAEDAAKVVSELEREVDLLRDDAKAHTLVKTLLEMKREQAISLAEIGTKPPPPAPKPAPAARPAAAHAAPPVRKAPPAKPAE